MKKLMLLGFWVVLVFCLVSCGSVSDSGNGNDNGNGSEIGIKKLIVTANGSRIGVLLSGGGSSYTFTNDTGYSATISRVTGYLLSIYSTHYETDDCTGTAYEQSMVDFPYSSKYVWRDYRNPNKMVRVSNEVPVVKEGRSYWSASTDSCEPFVLIRYFQSLAEISEAVSGIKIKYEPPIEIVED